MNEFIGRKEYLAKIMNRAKADKPKHLSIFGLPMIGKTQIVWAWQRQVIEDMKKKSSPERELYIFFSENKEGEKVIAEARFPYLDVVAKLLKDIKKDCKQRVGNNDTRFSSILNEIDENPCFDNAVTATEKLRDIIRKINDLNIEDNRKLRAVLVLDEFQAIENNWSEEDYRQFCSLLLDEELDLFCIVISRPELNYVVNKFTYKIIPFESLLINSYSEDDFNEFLTDLLINCVKNSVSFNLYNVKKSLLTACGKIPGLLSKAADYIDFAREIPSAQIFQTSFEGYYLDVATFLYEEEKKQLQSFTHIVKCYFRSSREYEDVLARYLGLGYVELVNQNDSLSEVCRQYSRYDDKNVLVSYYTTYCPGFINYLYTGYVTEDSKSDEKDPILNKIRDLRDLFTGLILTLRYITEMELREEFCGEPREWHEELFCRFRAQKYDREQRQMIKWYAIQSPDQNNPKITLWYYYPEERINREGGVWATQINEYENDDKMIEVTYNSLKYVRNALNESGQECDVLDSISLVDHGNILLKYPERFAKYFGVLGDLNHQWGGSAKNLLRNCLRVLQDDVRNKISHYSRRSTVSNSIVAKLYKDLCIELLKSIYNYIAIGKKKDSNIPKIEEVLNKIEALRPKDS